MEYIPQLGETCFVYALLNMWNTSEALRPCLREMFAAMTKQSTVPINASELGHSKKALKRFAEILGVRVSGCRGGTVNEVMSAMLDYMHDKRIVTRRVYAKNGAVNGRLLDTYRFIDRAKRVRDWLECVFEYDGRTFTYIASHSKAIGATIEFGPSEKLVAFAYAVNAPELHAEAGTVEGGKMVLINDGDFITVDDASKHGILGSRGYDAKKLRRFLHKHCPVYNAETRRFELQRVSDECDHIYKQMSLYVTEKVPDIKKETSRQPSVKNIRSIKPAPAPSLPVRKVAKKAVAKPSAPKVVRRAEAAGREKADKLIKAAEAAAREDALSLARARKAQVVDKAADKDVKPVKRQPRRVSRTRFEEVKKIKNLRNRK